MKDSFSKKHVTGIFKVVLTLAIFTIITGCNDDGPENPIPEDTRTLNHFILDNLSTYYLWEEHIPANTDPEHEPDPKAYFYSLLYQYKVIDKWSFITDDYEALKNSQSGIEESFGYEMALFYVEDKTDQADQVVAIVEYVIPDSPADATELKRGDLIYSINGTMLTDENYRDLLFKNTSYTLGFGEASGGTIVNSGESVDVTAVILQENPVFLYDVLEQDNQKIGYLVYNRFISDFEDELEDALADLQNAGITDLVLDLRYNPGGAVNTAIGLASMLAPAAKVNSEEVFIRFIWNDLLESYFIEKEGDDSDNLVLKFVPGNINLDLDRLYLIVSESSASASEVIINGLNPYMDVILIGTTTHGKYTASDTFRPEEPEIDNWAIQPIILRVANVEGVTDYTDGFPPDYYVEDDLFAPLGSLEEDMLAQAVSIITGTPVDQLARISAPPFSSREDKIMSVKNYPVLDRDELVVDTGLEIK